MGVSGGGGFCGLFGHDAVPDGLRLVMRDIGAYFGGTQFVVFLAKDGEIWRRYEKVRQAMEEEEMVGDEMDEEEDEEDELMSKTNKEVGEIESGGKNPDRHFARIEIR